MAKIEIIGTIAKIVRVAGKPGAQVVVSVPADKAQTIPLGDAYLSIESIQSELDLPADAGRRSGPKMRGKD